MNLTGVESYTQDVVLGAVILGAVLLDRLKKRIGSLRSLQPVDTGE
jgi:ribose/xylose/arabinose/galactoside ABC-type transport system permease subunit